MLKEISDSLRRIEIAVRFQFPGDTAIMVVEEWKKSICVTVDSDACFILEILIEQAIVFHRMRYKDGVGTSAIIGDGIAWVTPQLMVNIKALCESSNIWFEAKSTDSHICLKNACQSLIELHGKRYTFSANEVVSIWIKQTKQTLSEIDRRKLRFLIYAALKAHVEGAIAGKTDKQMAFSREMAFSRKLLLFKLNILRSRMVPDEIKLIENIWANFNEN